MSEHDHSPIKVKKRDEGLELVLSGRVDIFFAEELHAAARMLEDDSGPVHITCTDAEHMDTAALQILVALKRSIDEQGRKWNLSGMGDELLETIHLSGAASALGLAA